MTNWPPVTIGVITYNRPHELGKTLSALNYFLHYEGELRLLIADDASPGDYVSQVRSIVRDCWPEGRNHYISTPTNSGWGANANHLLAQAETDYLLMLEDDYVLQHDLDLNIGVALLESRSNIGMLRYRGTAGMHVIYHQFESDIADWLPTYQEGLGVPGKLTYFQLDSGSPDLWLYSNGPHLKRRSFHSFYGPYPQGLRLGQTEETYAHQVKDKMPDWGAPAIAILPEWVGLHWDHIGQTYQLTEMDKAHK